MVPFFFTSAGVAQGLKEGGAVAILWQFTQHCRGAPTLQSTHDF